MTGIELIAQERERQIGKEGWTPAHDAEHTDDSLALAAVSYAMPRSIRIGPIMGEWMDLRPPRFWPVSWNPSWWKPGPTRVRELAKSGALIAAEIDRLQRLAPSIPEKQVEEGSGKP